MEERDLLVNAISNPLVSTQLEEKIRLHFPEHLAFALSDPHASAPIVSEPELFGAHCQSNLISYNSEDFALNSELSLHSAGPDGTEHFDLMADISSPEHNGILFISVEIGVLQRLMKFGSTDTFSLALYESAVLSNRQGSTVLLKSDTRTMRDAQDALWHIGFCQNESIAEFCCTTVSYRHYCSVIRRVNSMAFYRTRKSEP